MDRAERELRNELSNWVSSRLSCDKAFVFATLTMKQGIKHPNGFWERLDEIKADQNAEWFCRALNKRVFGNRYRRGEEKLEIFDGGHAPDGDCQRFHRHMAIELPQRLTLFGFGSLISRLWRASKFGYRIMDVQLADNPSAVVQYGLKLGVDALNVSALAICNDGNEKAEQRQPTL